MRTFTALVRGTRLCLALLSLGCSAEEDTPSTRGAGGATTAVAGTTGSDGPTAGEGDGATAAAGTSGTNAAGGSAGSAGTQPRNTGRDTGQDQPCTTVGETRVCCDLGVQTCMGTGEFPVWGPCIDTGGAPIVECNPCASNEFGPGCDAGMPPPESPPDAGPPEEPLDAGPPDAGPPSECGPGMECKPGAVRYCDDPAGEWTKSTCDATGRWGACLPVPVPPAAVGHGDCSDFDYSPEMCCGPAMICCQDNPGGPWVDFGSGACAAVSCP